MREKYLPYGHHLVDKEDIQAVAEVLQSDWLTTGPVVSQFESAVCSYVGAEHGVAVSSGTAALHAAMFALGTGPGDEVIVPAMTFAATANCVVYQGARPVFADVEPETLLIDPSCVENLVTPRTKAIIAVDYAGQPCDWNSLRRLADRYGLALVADSCHALGAKLDGHPVGCLADITCFSFHPVKHITTGEGGMAVTSDRTLADRMRTFRNHGISSSASQREQAGQWFYEMTELGFNYRITDIQCAFGLSQMGKLNGWLARRRELAAMYGAFFASTTETEGMPLTIRPGVEHAWHLYVIRHPRRDEMFRAMRARNIGVNVHYVPVHLHPYYKEKFGTGYGLCPRAEAAYAEILTLPLWPGMTDDDVKRVIAQL